MDFSNLQINEELLPTIENLEYKGLHKDYLTVELIARGIFFFILIVAGSIFLGFNPANLPGWLRGSVFAFLLALIGLSIWHTIAAFKRMKYAIREHDIIYHHGLIWRSIIAVPFNRVQHAEVQQGPIERLFYLGRINVFTAGGSSSDLTISGLSLSDAHRIKQYILKQTVLDEEE